MNVNSHMLTPRTRMTSKGKAFAAAATLSMIVLTAACGGSSGAGTSTASTPKVSTGSSAPASSKAGEGTGGGGATTDLQAKVVKLREPSGAFKEPGPKVDGSPLRGKELWFIPVAAAIPVLGLEGGGVEQAAKALGMTYKECDGKYVPAAASTCITQAVNAGAGGIIIDAIDPLTVQPAVASAKDAKIPLVGITGGGKASSSYQPVSAGDAESQPVAMDWIAVDSQGKANVLAVTVKGNAETEGAAQAGADELQKVCPGCQRSAVEITASQSETLPSAVSTALLKDPNVKYGFPQFDFLAPLFQAGSQQAGRADSVKLVSTNAVLPQMQLVKSGAQAVDVGANRHYAGWLAADALVRLSVGAPPATSLAIPVRIFDAKNIGDIKLTPAAAVSGEWYGPTDYQTGFPKLWGLG